MIPWTPIDQIPEALKDGRPVLLWVDGACLDAVFRKGCWREWNDREYKFVPVEGVITHFAEINAPGEPVAPTAEGWDMSPEAMRQQAEESARRTAAEVIATIQRDRPWRRK